MSNKRTAPVGVTSDPASAQEHMNTLYTAHQVHTLAQVLFQHLAGGWQGRMPWMASPGTGLAPTWPVSAFGSSCTVPGAFAGSPAFAPAPPTTLFYWYP